MRKNAIIWCILLGFVLTGLFCTVPAHATTAKPSAEAGDKTPVTTPDFSFTETTKEIVPKEQTVLYVIKDTVVSVPVSGNAVSVKLEDSTVASAVSSNEIAAYEKAETRQQSTWDLENGYTVTKNLHFYGEKIGTTKVKLYEGKDAQDKPLGQIIEVNVVEPAIETDAQAVYNMLEGETISFQATYYGEIYWLAMEGREECIEVGGDATGKVTITALKGGTVRIILYDDNLGSYTDEKTPKSKEITINIKCNKPIKVSNQILAMNSGEEKTITVSSHRGCNYTASLKSGADVIATVSATGLKDGQQRLTVKGASNWKNPERNLYAVLVVSCACDPATKIEIPVFVHNTNPVVTQAPTPIPYSQAVKVTQKKKTLTTYANKSIRLSKYFKVYNKSKVSKYSYKSSNKKVAKVSSKGKVTCLKKGTARITLTIRFKDNSKKTLTYKIKVKKPKS